MLLDSLLQSLNQTAENIQAGCLMRAGKTPGGTAAVHTSSRGLVLMMAHHDIFCISPEEVMVSAQH